MNLKPMKQPLQAEQGEKADISKIHDIPVPVNEKFYKRIREMERVSEE